MEVKLNNNSITAVYLNGVLIDSVILNGVLVFTSGLTPPRITNVTVQSSSQVTVYWNDLTEGEDAFIINKSTNGGTSWNTAITGIDENSTSQVITGLDADTEYTFKVGAIKGIDIYWDTVKFTKTTYKSSGTYISGSSYCSGFDKRGLFADGYGGTTDELIESNSTDCDYVPPTTYTVTRNVFAPAAQGGQFLDGKSSGSIVEGGSYTFPSGSSGDFSWGTLPVTNIQSTHTVTTTATYNDPTPSTLSTPTGLSVGADTFSWNAVTNATGYYFEVPGAGSYTYTSSTSTSILPLGGTYKVYAVAAGFNDSNVASIVV